MNIEEILAGIEIYDGKYKREHIEPALNQKEEIIPHLIAILEKVREHPKKYSEDPNYHAHVYALMLLGHWREANAHQVIIDLASLPYPLPEDLFGDIVTEDLPIILLRTCGGSIENLKGLVTNPKAYDFSRGAAITAITYAVIEGIITREDALSFFGELFTGDELTEDSTEDSIFYSDLACSICNLYPEELMDTIRTAYDQELIDRTFVGIDSFERALKDGKEKCLANLRKKISNHSLDDIHKSMEWWACFIHESDKSFIPKQPILEFQNNPEPKPKKKKAFWDL
jgi:hypothetical protein